MRSSISTFTCDFFASLSNLFDAESHFVRLPVIPVPLIPFSLFCLPQLSHSSIADPPRRLYFHFNVKGSTLKAAVEARTIADGASKGWFAIGFSKTGKMAGSDVVLGNYVPSTNKKLPVGSKPGIGGPQPRPIAYLSATGTKTDNGTKSGGTGKKGSEAGIGSTNSTKGGNSGNSSNPGSGNVGKGGKHKGALVGAFNMQSLTMGTYAMADNFRIANASVTATKRGTVVRFTRSGPGGSVPVKYAGLNTIIWSYSSTGATKVFGGHMRHRDPAGQNKIGRFSLQRGLMGLESESQGREEVTVGAGETGLGERLAQEEGVRATGKRKRSLMGLRPGSQGGQLQQKPAKRVKSTLPGYTAMIALADYAGLFFHFKVKGSTLKAAVEARTVADGGASKGWFAISFSKTGKMADSDVILGNYIPYTNKNLPGSPKPGSGGSPQPGATGTTTENGTESGGTVEEGSGLGSGSKVR
ncbi:unnamed protein product [Closterium sp. NIES-65]|nr:unnamed protein product [Closterium sp. NIES-65]